MKTKIALMPLVALLSFSVASSFASLSAHPRPVSPQNSAAPSDQSATAKASGADSLPIPADEIIRRFAQHESEFKVARENYTYTQEVLVEDASGGQYRMVSDIVFSPQGRRYEEVKFAPVPTLHDFSLSPEDAKDLENIQPFVLTTEDLPKYDVKFLRPEKVDELNTYVFDVAPKRLEKNQRYFQGTIWVDAHDLAVVKSDGKAVPDIVKGSNENLFPRFVTYRENIEGNFWFPTYTHADDTLHFRSGDIHMRMTVRYSNYKRFGSTIRLGESKTVNNPPDPQTPQNKK